MGLAASGFYLAGRRQISKPAAQKTQQQQQQHQYRYSTQQALALALTQAHQHQAPSTKQSKSKPVAAQSGRFWLLTRRPPPNF
jgi:hypothetical protein